MSDAPFDGSGPGPDRGGSSGLLSRDRESLDKVVNKLRPGRRGFSVIVCPRETWGEATRYLAERSGRQIAPPVVVQTGDEMLDLLTEAQTKPHTEVVSFAIEDGNVPVLTALNWHREKTRRGAHCLAWLPTKDGLTAFVHRAPDAYSYRDYTLDLRGETKVAEGQPEEDTPGIRTARLLFDLPREADVRAEAAIELTRALFGRGRYDEGLNVAQQGLALIEDKRDLSARNREIWASLLKLLIDVHGSNGRAMDVYRLCQSGLQSNERIPPRDALRFEVTAALCSPFGLPSDALEAARRSPTSHVSSAIRLVVLEGSAEDAMRRGRFRDAARLLEEALSPKTQELVIKGRLHASLSKLWARAGSFSRADEALSRSQDAYFRAGVGAGVWERVRVGLLLDQSEIAAAERLSSSIGDPLWRAPLSLSWYRSSGDVRALLSNERRAMEDHFAASADRHVAACCLRLCRFLEGPLFCGSTEDDLVEAEEILRDAARRLRDWANSDPPWYDVFEPTITAKIVSLFDSRHEEAVTAARRAVEIARERFAPSLPHCAMVLVRCHARAGRWADIEPAIQTAIDAARTADHLIELSTVQAYNLVRLARMNADRAAIETAYSTLKKTFSEMGAPRLEADTWLEISPYLPAKASFPDALRLADHAHDLFFDMPMPEMASRSMEWIGDIHLERGEPSRAAVSYQMSLTTLKRYELTPRQKIVEEKLARAK